MSSIDSNPLKSLAGLMAGPPVDPRQQAARIGFMEGNVLYPVKAVILGILFYYLFLSDWFEGVRYIEELPMSMVRLTVLAHLAFNLVGAFILFRMHRYPMALVQWTVYLVNLLDALFLAAVSVVTGGTYIAYWVFLGLIIRNAVSVPVPPLQISLNLLVIGFYASAEIMDKLNIESEVGRPFELELAAGPNYLITLTLQIFLMLLLTACCYGVQVLFDRQRQAEEESREFTVRQEQLQAAGRLAAEIAHQIKNPLAIINNTVYSLQRSIQEGKGDPLLQLQIIREEVDRSDRIITELMGYAQLAEGKVEKLNVNEELDYAIERVFPPGAKYQVKINRRYAPGLPSLKMQRGHLSEVFVNILQNAREAMGGSGNIDISARSDDHYDVIVTIRDTGPGIPAEKMEMIFEPYFTTKEKGTGLGLAIVKHNTELYGGSVRVESEIGKGTAFVLQFPAKALLRYRK